MANWSTVEIHIEGTETQLKQVISILDIFIKDSYLIHENSEMSIDTADLYTDSLIIYGEGRWSAPYELFEALAETYNLTLDYYEEEPGSDFTLWFKYNNGEQKFFIEDKFTSQTRIHRIGIYDFWDSIEWVTPYPILNYLTHYKLLLRNGITPDEIREWLINANYDGNIRNPK